MGCREFGRTWPAGGENSFLGDPGGDKNSTAKAAPPAETVALEADGIFARQAPDFQGVANNVPFLYLKCASHPLSTATSPKGVHRSGGLPSGKADLAHNTHGIHPRSGCLKESVRLQHAFNYHKTAVEVLGRCQSSNTRGTNQHTKTVDFQRLASERQH